MNACPSKQFRASRASFISFPAFSQFSFSLFLSRALLGVSESRNRGREHRGVVAVMNASWGNGVPLIVQRVVPSLGLSRPFFPLVLLFSAASFHLSLSLPPLSSRLSLQRRRQVRTEFKMHGYASFILNYELERLWPGESSITERGREREKTAIRLSLVELVRELGKSRWEWNFWYLWHWLHARLVEHRRFYPTSSLNVFYVPDRSSTLMLCGSIVVPVKRPIGKLCWPPWGCRITIRRRRIHLLREKWNICRI